MRALTLVIGLVACARALADQDLVAKRDACQAEAGQRIKPKCAVGPEVARKLIARRMELVRECIERPTVATKDHVTVTGALKPAKSRP